jgi:hypothetical protein
MKACVLMVGAAALCGCAAVRSPPEPAMPSSKAERIPLNQPNRELASAPSVSGLSVDRVRRAAPEEAAAQAGTQTVTSRFVHGASRPLLLCAAAHVCDLELQAGERIAEHIRIGDKARWGLDVVYVKHGGAEVPHLLLTPAEPGIETSMVILTNRRTYHLQLRATRSTSMLHAAFTYPEDLAARWKNLPAVPGEAP